MLSKCRKFFCWPYLRLTVQLSLSLSRLFPFISNINQPSRGIVFYAQAIECLSVDGGNAWPKSGDFIMLIYFHIVVVTFLREFLSLSSIFSLVYFSLWNLKTFEDQWLEMEGATRLRQPQEHTPAASERGVWPIILLFRLHLSYDIIEDIIHSPFLYHCLSSHLLSIVDVAWGCLRRGHSSRCLHL